MLRTATDGVRPFARLALAGVLCAGGLAACKDAAAPKGKNGTITARAYVDRDASGTFTTADSALSGLTVTLQQNGATVQSGTTDAQGKVTFSDVAPGSYQIVAPAAPTGAALTTNPLATAAVNFQGSSPSVDIRYVFFPSAISGRLYRDDNTNGTFDATDTPGAGIKVRLLLSNNGTPGAAVDSTTTDDQGLYSFPRIAPGRYIVQFENPNPADPNFFGAGGGQVTVNAAPTQTTTATTTFTGSLVVPISTARARATNSRVAVRGDVTVPVGAFVSGTGSEVWIQDATGGISIFAIPNTRQAEFPIGQRVEASGCIGVFSGQKQIQSNATISCPLTVTPIAGGSVVAPKVVTGSGVNALTLEGQLVTISGLVIDSIPTQTPVPTAFNVRATAPDGQKVRIRVHNTSTGLTPSSFQIGARYSVTGVLTQNGGVAVIKPRSPSDVAGPTPIGTVRATTPAGGTFTVSGVVTVPPGVITSGTGLVNSEVWVQDATGGIAVFSIPTANPAGIQLGDQIEVTGTTSVFNGQLQISAGSVTRIGAGTPVTPLDQTGAQIAARTNEGKLVRLAGFTVTSVGTASSTTGAYTVTGTAADGTSGIQIRINGPLGTTTNSGIARTIFNPGSTYTITGVLSQFNGTAQIKPRSPADVVQTS